MRARNIKPAFFDSDQLAACEPLARILFAGMWCVADYRGFLEYRPARLKKQILGYDECEIEDLVRQLEANGLIRNHHFEGDRYIAIPGFKRHQNPHKQERDRGSDLPDLDALPTETGTEPEPVRTGSGGKRADS